MANCFNKQQCSRVWLGIILAVVVPEALAEEQQNIPVMGQVTVTATREERSVAEVPQAIAVIGKDELQEKKMFNLKEALQDVPGVLIDSKNGGFDARLIIRGAGLKAPYGIREIMVLRDGVPLSDPDSFTRLDFVDTQDIERVEVAKGPGNLFATGSSGGAIQIFSKSVFDENANSLKIGAGNYGTRNYHLRYGVVGEEQALAVTATQRSMDNDWRVWNRFDTSQTSLKHGFMRSNGDLLESEISYAEANMQLPGTMDKTLFDQFVASGRQTATSEAWKNSGRYSKVWFFNTKYEMERGNVTFKPRFYYNTWYHYHPVTGLINETEDWVWNLGTDLETQYKHESGSLVGGVTLRKEQVPDSRKYKYGSVITTTSGGACVNSASATGRIIATCSDAKGQLASTSTTSSLLRGLYLQESWRPARRWIVDAGMRYDLVTMKDNTNEIFAYNYATGTYSAGAGAELTDKTYTLPAPKLAANYQLNDVLHLFAMAAQAGQIPSSGEIAANPNLEAPLARNYEVGVKGRSGSWSFDTSLYHNPVEKEIVQINTGAVTEYVNAGKTDKRGVEFSGRYALSLAWEVGAHYSYSDYTYVSFTEPVRVGSTTVNRDRSGNRLPFVPEQQYGIFVGWKFADGWSARLDSNSWGSYWLDNANTEKYKGWEWVSNLSMSYARKQHSLTLNVDNITDQHYAFEVKKDTSGKVTYSAASPRTTMLTYRYNFE